MVGENAFLSCLLALQFFMFLVLKGSWEIYDFLYHLSCEFKIGTVVT